MIIARSAAVGLASFLLFQLTLGALVAKEKPDVDESDTPALPPCKLVNEARTPMPIWSPEELRDDGKLSSAPPAFRHRVIYVNAGVYNDFADCHDAPDDKVYRFDFRDPKTGAGDVKINITGQVQFVGFGAVCAFVGFYTDETVTHDGISEINLRPANKFDVMSSGRYCLGKWTQADPEPAPAAPMDHPEQRTSLPICKREGEDRVPIPAWKPKDIEVNIHSYLSSEPPTRDGMIVYISIPLGRNFGPTCAANDSYTLDWPDNLKRPIDGGTEVELHGNAHRKNGRCVLEGFYMNETVEGVLQGYVSTYFGAVDENKLISSGTYCLARPVAPKRRVKKSQ